MYCKEIPCFLKSLLQIITPSKKEKRLNPRNAKAFSGTTSYITVAIISSLDAGIDMTAFPLLCGIMFPNVNHVVSDSARHVSYFA